MGRPTSANGDTRNLRDLLLLALPALLLVAAAFALAWQFVKPAPPKKIVITTGVEGGAYQYFGERYREKFAQEGIEVELRPSSGAVENLRRLKTDDDVDVGFIQGGIANEPESEDLATLGSMYLEPVWVFYRGDSQHDRIYQLKGRKIAIGVQGSGAQLFALQLLAANGFATNDPKLLAIGGMDAVDALRRGEIDAFFVVGAPQAPVVDALLHTDGISLLNFAQADGYVRHFPHLVKVVLPRAPSRSTPTNLPATSSCWPPPPTWWCAPTSTRPSSPCSSSTPARSTARPACSRTPTPSPRPATTPCRCTPWPGASMIPARRCCSAICPSGWPCSSTGCW